MMHAVRKSLAVVQILALLVAVMILSGCASSPSPVIPPRSSPPLGVDENSSTDTRQFSSFDVLAFGAVGDGKTDCTAAFQRALNAAGATGGGVVNVAAGAYRLGGSLVIPSGVTLQGIWRSPHHSDATYGSLLLATSGRGSEDGPALLELQSSSCVRGLTIMYPDQNVRDIQPYPWTIRGRGHNP
ncbi:MAG: glycosyl hydrolase family 28-related protein, partial [bacterium]